MCVPTYKYIYIIYIVGNRYVPTSYNTRMISDRGGGSEIIRVIIPTAIDVLISLAQRKT